MAEEKVNRVFDAQFIVIGITLIIIGIFLFLGNFLNFLSITYLWPFFLMIPVPIFAWLLLQDFRKNYGVLVPTGILTFLTIYFVWLNFAGWSYVDVTWPNFILAPAVGLFMLYLANRQNGLLIPVFILTATALVFYGTILKSSIAIAAFFILGGLALIYGAFRRKKQ